MGNEQKAQLVIDAMNMAIRTGEIRDTPFLNRQNDLCDRQQVLV